MTTSIASQVISLGSMLRRGDTYLVPPYQRNYAWDESQFGAFWSDIHRTFSDTRSEYLLGSIVINNGRAPELVVIDGQQRLITTAVLISALRSHLREEGKTELAATVQKEFLARSEDGHQLLAPRLVLNKTDKLFYDYISRSPAIAEMRGRLADDETLSPSNRLLAECFCFMHRRIGDIRASGQSMEQIANAIIESLDRVVVIRIDVKDDYNAFLLFETLNDRGLELSEADLLKNHLFSISGHRLNDAQGHWERMEECLGSERPIKFIRHHWLSTNGMIGERGLYSDIKARIAAPGDAVAYSKSLEEASESYAALLSHDHEFWTAFPREEERLIRELIKAIEILRPEQLFIVLLAALEIDKRNFLELTRMLVIFTFRYNTICNLSASHVLAPFITIAREIRQTGKANASLIFQKYLAQLYPDDSQFHSAFSRKVVRSNAQTRYILKKINDHLSPNELPRTKDDQFTAEHILPRRYSDSWDTSRRDFPGGADKYVYRLGNATLISAKLNHELGNADFETKKKKFAIDCPEITQKVLAVREMDGGGDCGPAELAGKSRLQDLALSGRRRPLGHDRLHSPGVIATASAPSWRRRCLRASAGTCGRP